MRISELGNLCRISFPLIVRPLFFFHLFHPLCRLYFIVQERSSKGGNFYFSRVCRWFLYVLVEIKLLCIENELIPDRIDSVSSFLEQMVVDRTLLLYKFDNTIYKEWLNFILHFVIYFWINVNLIYLIRILVDIFIYAIVMS